MEAVAGNSNEGRISSAENCHKVTGQDISEVESTDMRAEKLGKKEAKEEFNKEEERSEIE
jgi:hypothetical protein